VIFYSKFNLRLVLVNVSETGYIGMNWAFKSQRTYRPITNHFHTTYGI